jgi:hypothetical protein
LGFLTLTNGGPRRLRAMAVAYDTREAAADNDRSARQQDIFLGKKGGWWGRETRRQQHGDSGFVFESSCPKKGFLPSVLSISHVLPSCDMIATNFPRLLDCYLLENHWSEECLFIVWWRGSVWLWGWGYGSLSGCAVFAWAFWEGGLQIGAGGSGPWKVRLDAQMLESWSCSSYLLPA